MTRVLLCTLICFIAAQNVHAGEFVVFSPQITEGKQLSDEQVFNGFDCHGGNVSPELTWAGAPEGTKSFAVTMYDRDAPTGSGWWHWVMFNIPATVNSLNKNAGNAQSNPSPSGNVQSRTDYGKTGYGGPCPPAGDRAHRYEITVYALKLEKLPLDENAPAAMVGYYLHQNTIKKAALKATYSR